MFADRIECAFNIIDGLGEAAETAKKGSNLKQKNKKNNKKGRGQVVRKSAGNPRESAARQRVEERRLQRAGSVKGSSPSPSSRPSTAPEVNIADKKVREKHGVRKTRRPLSSSSSSNNNNNGRGARIEKLRDRVNKESKKDLQPLEVNLDEHKGDIQPHRQT